MQTCCIRQLNSGKFCAVLSQVHFIHFIIASIFLALSLISDLRSHSWYEKYHNTNTVVRVLDYYIWIIILFSITHNQHCVYGNYHAPVGSSWLHHRRQAARYKEVAFEPIAKFAHFHRTRFATSMSFLNEDV